MRRSFSGNNASSRRACASENSKFNSSEANRLMTSAGLNSGCSASEIPTPKSLSSSKPALGMTVAPCLGIASGCGMFHCLYRGQSMA